MGGREVCVQVSNDVLHSAHFHGVLVSVLENFVADDDDLPRRLLLLFAAHFREKFA